MDVTNLNTVKLQEPIKQGDGEITELTLREPTAGELRGLKLFDVMQCDVTSMMKLLPRITSPSLSPETVERLSLPDLTALGMRVTAFFVSRDQLKDQNLLIDG